MNWKRFLKSIVNMILSIINLILWLLDMKSVGSMATGIEEGKTRNDKLKFGAAAFLQWVLYATIVGLIVTIYFWFRDEESIAERVSGVKQTSVSAST